jgi:hypothetical protein
MVVLTPREIYVGLTPLNNQGRAKLLAISHQYTYGPPWSKLRLGQMSDRDLARAHVARLPPFITSQHVHTIATHLSRVDFSYGINPLLHVAFVIGIEIYLI